MTKNSASELAARKEWLKTTNIFAFWSTETSQLPKGLFKLFMLNFLVLREDANFEDLYKQGREAYLDNNYPDCVKYIEAALRNSVF